MPAFGDRFINLAEFEPSGTLRNWDCSYVLNNAIDVLMGRAVGHSENRANPGGSIYLPPGRWPFGLYSAAPVVIPEEVELVVAPGAVIVPHNFFGTPEVVDVVLRPALEIHGDLSASTGMFISTTAFEEHHRGTLSGASNRPLFPVGWISFPTRAIDSVHPEWWGAGALADDDSDRPAVDTAALEAALRAALFRTPWSTLVEDGAAAFRNDPLAIEVLTQVQMEQGILIGSRAWFISLSPGPMAIVVPSVAGLVLRGRRGATKPHVVGAYVGPEPRMVLLASAYPDGLRLEDLWVDVGAGFDSDLLVMFSVYGEGSSLDVVDCTFTGRASRLVWTYMLSDFFREGPSFSLSLTPSPIFSSGVWVGEVTPDRLSFSGCRFAPSSGQAGLAYGLWVHAAAVQVNVWDSTFSGPARAMVVVSAGALRAYNCTFANTATPWEWLGPFLRRPRDGVRSVESCLA